jgi:hypothetical protein
MDMILHGVKLPARREEKWTGKLVLIGLVDAFTGIPVWSPAKERVVPIDKTKARIEALELIAVSSPVLGQDRRSEGAFYLRPPTCSSTATWKGYPGRRVLRINRLVEEEPVRGGGSHS